MRLTLCLSIDRVAALSKVFVTNPRNSVPRNSFIEDVQNASARHNELLYEVDDSDICEGDEQVRYSGM